MAKKREDNPTAGAGDAWQSRQALVSFLFKYFNFVIVLLVLFIAVYGFLSFVIPKYRDIRENIALKNESKQKELSDMDQYLSKLNNYINNYNKIDQLSKDKLSKLLPEMPDTEQLFTQLEYIILKKGLLLNNMKISETEKREAAKISAKDASDKYIVLPADIGEVNIEVDMMGVSYRALKDILKTFENNLRLMDIQEIRYSPVDGNLALNIKAYYHKRQTGE